MDKNKLWIMALIVAISGITVGIFDRITGIDSSTFSMWIRDFLLFISGAFFGSIIPVQKRNSSQ